MGQEKMKLPKIDQKAFSVVEFYDWWWNGDPAPPFLHLEKEVVLEFAKVKMAYELDAARARVTALENMNKLLG